MCDTGVHERLRNHAHPAPEWWGYVEIQGFEGGLGFYRGGDTCADPPILLGTPGPEMSSLSWAPGVRLWVDQAHILLYVFIIYSLLQIKS